MSEDIIDAEVVETPVEPVVETPEVEVSPEAVVEAPIDATPVAE